MPEQDHVTAARPASADGKQTVAVAVGGFHAGAGYLDDEQRATQRQHAEKSRAEDADQDKGIVLHQS